MIEPTVNIKMSTIQYIRMRAMRPNDGGVSHWNPRVWMVKICGYEISRTIVRAVLYACDNRVFGTVGLQFGSRLLARWLDWVLGIVTLI